MATAPGLLPVGPVEAHSMVQVLAGLVAGALAGAEDVGNAGLSTDEVVTLTSGTERS